MKLKTIQWRLISFIGTSFVLGACFLLAAASLLIFEAPLAGPFAQPQPAVTPTPQTDSTPQIRGGGLIGTPAPGAPQPAAPPLTATVRPGQSATLPDPGSLFEAPFRPEPDGFGFRNYGSRYPEGDLSVTQVQELFGDDICASGSGANCVPIPAAQTWINLMNDHMANGHCAGFTVASHRFYEAQLSPTDFAAVAQTTFEIDQNVPTMHEIAKDWSMQVTEEVWQARVQGGPREVVDQLLQVNEPVDLGIFGRTGGGHSLLAYGVEDKGGGLYGIKIYDNNWPGRELSVDVDYNANTWRYSLAATNPQADVSAWEGDEVSKTLMFIPFEVYDQPVTCPFCEGRNTKKPTFNYISMTGDEALLQATDNQGRRIGHFGDEFINEITGARLIRLKDRMYNDYEPYLALPETLPFTVRILPRPGQEIANASLYSGGAGFTFIVDGLELPAGQVGAVSVIPGEGLIFFADALLNPLLKLIKERNGESTYAVVGNTSVAANENFKLSLDPTSGELILSNQPGAGPSGAAGTPANAPLNPSGEANTVSLALAVVGNNQLPLIFVSTALPLPAGGSAALDVANWTGSGPMTVRLDRNGDNSYEESWTVSNEPVANLLASLDSSQDIRAMLGELGPYLDQTQAHALLLGLAENGSRCSASNTLTNQRLDGDDLGEVLYALNRLRLNVADTGVVLSRLGLPPEELADLIFELRLPQADQAALISSLNLAPEQAAALQNELAAAERVNQALDEWEWQNFPLNQLPAFLQGQNLTVAQIGFFLDELNLEPTELNDILAALNLSDDQLAVVFYELNITETQWNVILTSLGRQTRLIETLVTGRQPSGGGTPVSSWDTAGARLAGCTLLAQALTPTPTLLPTLTPTPLPGPTFTPTPTSGGGGGGGGGGPSNSSPVINGDNPIVNMNIPTTLNVLANDSDPDGNALTIASVTSPGSGAVGISSNGGQVAINAVGNTLIYTPSLNFVGSDSFSYTASDGKGGSGSATVNVTVRALVEVDTTSDASLTGCSSAANDCSLRGAITLLTSITTLTRTVAFSIPGAGPHTLNIGSALPTVSQPLVFDGTTQPGASCTSWPPNLQIVLNGGGGAYDGLNISAGNSTVKGLVIQNFGNDGIDLNTAGSNTIQCNFIGTNQAGTTAGPRNTGSGVRITSANNIVGGINATNRNLLSGNISGGILITGSIATANLVQGNYIGTNVNGSSTITNNTGLLIYTNAANNTIGGTTGTTPGGGCTGACNLISGNTNAGIDISVNSANNTVQGNYVGTDAAGLLAVPNSTVGIFIRGGASNNIIGGTSASARNLFSGNAAHGIDILDPGTNGNTVQGNYIGINTTGGALGNGGYGIRNTTNGLVIVGGSTATAGNIFANNSSGGISNAAGTNLQVSFTTFSNHNKLGFGGGIENYGTISVTNSTISGNNSSGPGGGIFNSATGIATITNSTVASNTNSNIRNAGTLNLLNTIVANKVTGSDCNGAVTSVGYNLASDASCIAFLTATSDITNTNPLLGPLQNNGGPTSTHGLLPGSPAIDQGNCPGFSTDQRGSPRPVDKPPANITDGCDMGAFEVQ